MTKFRLAALAALTGALALGPASGAVGSSDLAVAEPSATIVAAPRVALTALGLMATARHSIDLEMYELGNPAIVAGLEAAKRRGVSVRVVSDPTETQSKASDARLERAGIAVRKLAVRGGIDHVKLLVVDHAQVLVGGVNFGRDSSATTDGDVVLSGAAGTAAASVFNRDWAAAGGTGISANGIYGPFVTGRAILPAMLSIIGHASTSCTVIANYLSDYRIQDALVAAKRRGVAVTAVLNPTGYGEAAAAAWLEKGRVHVEIAPTRPYLHAKILACGSEAMIGSANFSYHGMAVNHELDVVLDGRAGRMLGDFALGVARADR